MGVYVFQKWQKMGEIRDGCIFGQIHLATWPGECVLKIVLSEPGQTICGFL